jgi:hypothetical protein
MRDIPVAEVITFHTVSLGGGDRARWNAFVIARLRQDTVPKAVVEALAVDASLRAVFAVDHL